MNTQRAISKDSYSRNFKCLSLVLFPFYDSYHRHGRVTLKTSNALQTVFKDIAVSLLRAWNATFVNYWILITSLIK